ncbi:MAG: hypothetical protein ACYS99_20530 [Planctomycetota bacterium]|jgi:hypothetical protein
MNCNDIRDRILSGLPPDGPEIERHLEECDPCRELLASRGLASLFRDTAPGPDVPVALSPPPIGGALDRVRSLTTPIRVAALAVCVFLVGALNALLLLRGDAPAYPAVRMTVVLAAFSGSALAAGIFVLRPLHLPRPTGRVLPGFIGGGILLAVVFGLLPAAHALTEAHPESFEGTGADFWPRAIGCLIYGTVMGLPVLGFLWLLGRGGKARSTTVLVGLTATALAGNVALQLHCPLVSQVHLLVGHAGVPVALVLIGLPFALRRRTG